MSEQSTFLPNTFQTPNQYVDEYLSYLTGEEVKVLLYATRRILGFQKRQDHISISLFMDGMKSKGGETLDKGTGLSKATVKKCLKSLVDFGLMVKVGDNDKTKNEGDLWSLQWDKSKVNKKALEDRENKKAEKQKTKMKKARSMRHTPANGIDHPPVNDIDQPPANGIDTQNPVETQGNPDLIKQSAEIFKGYFGKFYGQNERIRWETIYEAVGENLAEKIAAWAFKKEIHLTNRGGLLDSMETAAKNWRSNHPGGNNKSNGQDLTVADRWLLQKEQELSNGRTA